MPKSKKFPISIIFLFQFLLAGNSLASSQELICAKEPLTKSQKIKLENKIKKSQAYIALKSLNPQSLKISVDSCNEIRGGIQGSYIAFEDVLGKKCSINSMSFSLRIDEEENISFPLNLSREGLKKALESIGQSDIASKFFEKNTFCQIEFISDKKELKWIIQLRDKQKNFCFLESSLNGKRVKIIPRLYAKDSKCL